MRNKLAHPQLLERRSSQQHKLVILWQNKKSVVSYVRLPACARPISARKPVLQIYLSRIPRFMKPITVRQRMEKFGEVTRVYIVPEGELTCDLYCLDRCTKFLPYIRRPCRSHGAHQAWWQQARKLAGGLDRIPTEA